MLPNAANAPSAPIPKLRGRKSTQSHKRPASSSSEGSSSDDEQAGRLDTGPPPKRRRTWHEEADGTIVLSDSEEEAAEIQQAILESIEHSKKDNSQPTPPLTPPDKQLGNDSLITNELLSSPRELAQPQLFQTRSRSNSTAVSMEISNGTEEPPEKAQQPQIKQRARKVTQSKYYRPASTSGSSASSSSSKSSVSRQHSPTRSNIPSAALLLPPPVFANPQASKQQSAAGPSSDREKILGLTSTLKPASPQKRTARKSANAIAAQNRVVETSSDDSGSKAETEIVENSESDEDPLAIGARVRIRPPRIYSSPPSTARPSATPAAPPQKLPTLTAVPLKRTRSSIKSPRFPRPNLHGPPPPTPPPLPPNSHLLPHFLFETVEFAALPLEKLRRTEIKCRQLKQLGDLHENTQPDKGKQREITPELRSAEQQSSPARQTRTKNSLSRLPSRLDAPPSPRRLHPRPAPALTRNPSQLSTVMNADSDEDEEDTDETMIESKLDTSWETFLAPQPHEQLPRCIHEMQARLDGEDVDMKSICRKRGCTSKKRKVKLKNLMREDEFQKAMEEGTLNPPEIVQAGPAIEQVLASPFINLDDYGSTEAGRTIHLGIQKIPRTVGYVELARLNGWNIVQDPEQHQ